MKIRTYSYLAALVVGFTLFGCGGGGGGTLTGGTNLSDYQGWIQGILSDEKTVVGDSTAHFVDLGGTENTSILTNLVGWVRVSGETSIDKLAHRSTSPDKVESLLTAGTNTIETAGQSLDISQEFTSSSTVGLNIPIVSAMLNFAKSKSVSGKFTLSISFERGKVTWLSSAGIANLLEHGDFSPAFLNEVTNRKATIFQGAVALHNVQIKMSTSISSSSGIKVGDTFKDSKTGIGVTVDTTDTSSSTVTVGLSAADDLFIGISERGLGPEDLGRLVKSDLLEVGNTSFNEEYNVGSDSWAGTYTLRHQGGGEITGLSLLRLATFGDLSGVRTKVVTSREIYSDILPMVYYPRPFDLRPFGDPSHLLDLKTYVISWKGSDSDQINPQNGRYRGEIRDLLSGELLKTVSGFISADGTVFLADTTSGEEIMAGSVDSSGNYELRNGIDGNTSVGHMGTRDGLLLFGVGFTGEARLTRLADEA